MRDTLLTLLEVAFLIAAVVGLGLWSVPLALVVGGVLGAVACEWADRRPRGIRSDDGEPGPRSAS